MAINIGKVEAKILVQFGNSEPIEVGTIEVPIELVAVPKHDDKR